MGISKYSTVYNTVILANNRLRSMLCTKDNIMYAGCTAFIRKGNASEYGTTTRKREGFYSIQQILKKANSFSLQTPKRCDTATCEALFCILVQHFTSFSFF
uniref:Uncharacterized protein n=1 Tax=Palpitomonas bilix TaxID=652834 RepID=A0A7S3G2K6_9EUKA|mmetsp:Transcript_206/g.249  ORF Transcript_206/g.249 Transcript_206/m.249 type:complete len:101 (+) Transcript_206:179-481(+)